MKYDYDLFTIGAGSGGVRAARMSAGFGARVAIAEDRYLGGTCVNVGCVPKKLFVFASHYAEDFGNARGFGWHSAAPEFHWSDLLTNKNAEISRLNGIYRRLLDDAGVQLFNDRATIADAHSISIGAQTVTAEKILIATGGWPVIPDFPGKEHAISSNEAFFLDRLPERIMIVGGGYIAVEFAGIFNGLGVETTLLYRGPLFLRGFDEDCRKFLAQEIAKKGINLCFNSNINRIEKNGAVYTAELSDGTTRETDLIMYATGRVPNTVNLGLEHAGVELNDKGAIIINEHYQSTAPSVYAIGDVTDKFNLTPVATAEGTALAKRLYAGSDVSVDYANIPTCIFSQPNLGTVGLTEEQARKKYRAPVIYKSAFTPLRHSLTGSGEQTLIKMIVDRQSDRVIGVHMVGSDAGEIIQGIAVAMKAGATKQHFDETIGIHPTTAEEFVTMREPATTK